MDVSKINYSIAKDIGFIMEAEGITLEEVSLLTSISRTTLYEIIAKNYTIDIVYEKFYSYVYNLKYRLNSVKEDLLKETNKQIVLFHGSKFGLKEVCVNGARSTCDFGNGFYCTIIKEQAQRWAKRYDTKVVSIYDVRIDSSMAIKEFKEMGYRKLGGKKLESYSFYTLVGYYTIIKKGGTIK